MSARTSEKPAALEPERYEAFEPPAYHFDVERRDFLKVLGGGIGVFLLVGNPALAQESGRGQLRMPALPQNVGAWLRIAPDGKVTVFTGKVEVGQNVRTSLAQQVSEELHVALDSISMVMGDTERTPYDMGTFGSLTTPTMGPQLRKIASVARDMLIDMAARKWQVDRGRLVAANGTITDKETGRSIPYAALAQGETLAKTVAAEDPLTPPSEWKVAGKPAPKVNAVDFVTGRHQYTPDVRLPGMMYGKVLRPPSYGATLGALDDTQAKAIHGAIVVRDGNFAGVVAPTPEAAERALGALRPQWNAAPAETSSEGVYDYIRKNAVEAESGERGNRLRHAAGSIEAGMAAAHQRLEQTYTVAYIAHAPLEPRAAVAQWENGKLTVWTGTQRPFAVRDDLASLFKVDAGSVHVVMPDTGAAYGGKHTGDAAPEAARLARAAGKPVKLVWTREEEFTWAYFRPVGVMEVRAGLGADRRITAWEYHNYNSGPSAIATPYDIPNQLVQFHPTKYPLRQGSYRALAATANHFARESAMDELARMAGAEPLAFRLKHLSDPRLAAVFQAAAKKFGWPRRKIAPGQGFGIAGGIEKNGRIATCAEVSVDRKSGSVRVVHVVAAFECGAIVNPDGLNNQVSGAQVMGLGGALFEAIEFADGKISNAAFSRYRVPRFRDLPAIDVVLVDRTDQPPAGAGETPIVGLAPAVGNAIFDATGVRLRSMPMAPHGLKT
ncbi:MAG TPA: molybdopterin cofactor-binding domain-containing protein [Candidatus Acidoferrales bacterium]|nr:molybdopterin cofactor-binding domain-containing protein [Candidatus Acidoferrales bacterium]